MEALGGRLGFPFGGIEGIDPVVGGTLMGEGSARAIKAIKQRSILERLITAKPITQQQMGGEDFRESPHSR